MSDITYKNGMIIEHPNRPQWGLGKVVAVEGDRVHVVFKNELDQKAKVIVTSVVPLTISEISTDPVLDCLPPASKEGSDWLLPKKFEQLLNNALYGLDVTTIRLSLGERDAGHVKFEDFVAIESRLNKKWDISQLTDADEQGLDCLYEMSAADVRDKVWLIGMSTPFRKAVSALDKKLKGRILEAMGVIAQDPMTPLGDTVKALTGELAGLWRYRIGDYRLVYQPDPAKGQVFLVDFGGRGSIYE